MQDLKSLNKLELEEFFNSFDQVLSDVDGVLWQLLENIPGADDGIRSLKKIGKKVAFVSNNTTKSLSFYHKQLQAGGFDVEREEIITPASAIISHLKKQNVTKQIYIIGMSALRNEIEKAGFQIAENPPDRIEENLDDFVRHTVVNGENIGAVILDTDVNVNYLKLQRASTYLTNPNILFITGATDQKLPVGSNLVFIGPGYFHKILEDISGRTAYALAKPSTNLNDYIVEKIQIKDRSRVLFIGDTVLDDMAFAAKCGYKKLLVLSGVTKKDSIENWTFPEEFKPDYYVDSLKTIHDLISQNLKNKL